MLLSQLFLVVCISVVTANIIGDSKVQNSSAAPQVDCGGKICKNGATCKTGNICDCPTGTKGDECEVVIGCDKLKETCDKLNTECVYNHNQEAPTCKCTDEKQAFNGSSCVDCECGEFMSSCEFNLKGNKYCFCQKGYSDKSGMCSPCNCGAPDFEELCFITEGKENFCTCKKEYAKKAGICTECTCGAQTKSCDFDSMGKFCICNEGYKFKLGTCAECNCGANSTDCLFRDTTGEQICYCTYGNADKLGTCTHCDCGPDTICSFTSSGEKKCDCIGKLCQEPLTPWFRNPVGIVCIVALVGIVVFTGGFVAYRKLRRN